MPTYRVNVTSTQDTLNTTSTTSGTSTYHVRDEEQFIAEEVTADDPLAAFDAIRDELGEIAPEDTVSIIIRPA